jgi:hypothetical protein
VENPGIPFQIVHLEFPAADIFAAILANIPDAQAHKVAWRYLFHVGKESKTVAVGNACQARCLAT